MHRTHKEVRSEISENGCWEVISHAPFGFGYSHMMINGKFIMLHRWQWEQFNGKIPEGMFVCHHCDNPRCINPEHLFLGTARDNSNDMRKKNRHPFMKKPYYTKEEANQANKNWYKKYNHRNLLHQWDEIKNEPNAIKIDDEVGYLKTSLWIEKQGFTLSQVGSFLGVSRQRVLQLIQKKSHRIEKAIEIMRSTP